MHSRGDVADMATFAHASYGDDVVGEIVAELRRAVAARERGGIARERIVLDPGIGFCEARRAIDRRAAPAAAYRGARVSGAGGRVAKAVHRRDHGRRRSPADRVAGTVGANVAALDARRAAVSRPRRAARPRSAGRRVGDLRSGA